MDIDDDNSEPPPPGTGSLTPIVNLPSSSPGAIKLSSKGVENAKKRLRAFSIQKKTPITPLLVPKPSGSGNSTVVIGKLSSVKTTPKPDVEPDVKKPPKPPKPGTARKALQDSYSDLQKKTLSEIEDMKRKMELVELGIPLGLICPTATSEKAMPTKAMPPIKSFLSPEQLDEIIREAKKAKAEGRKFKFDYQKLLPDYDNPFQKKKEDPHEKDRHERRKSDYGKDDERRRSDKYEYKKHSDYRSEDKHKHRYKDKEKDKERSKSEHKKPAEKQATDKETDVDLKDFLVCDSWSLDNDDKIPLPSPKIDENLNKQPEPSEIHKASLDKTNAALKLCIKDSPKKVEKLKPVIDSFKFEIDPNEDDEVLDIFDENLGLNNYAQRRLPKPREETPKSKSEIDIELYDKDMTEINEDTFLESVINEIKQENMSDDECEKGLVEYDESPSKESPGKKRSATPDIIELGSTSQRSDCSGYASTDSYRTTGTNESGYKSVESSSFRLSPEKELNASLQDSLSRPTVDSLETWSFVLKICQPLLFRHDKNKCYKETHIAPKIWYTENPKHCMCVKDRAIVYEELEMCKMNLVDRVYGCDQIPDSPMPICRNWYPRSPLSSTSSLPMSNEWEADDSQQDRPETPQRSEEILLDREYQRFMEAVESKVESSRSTTPVQQEAKKKRKDDVPKQVEEKKIKKLNNEDWSQESDIEMEVEKTKKLKEKEKSRLRKRKHSSSTQTSVSENEDSKKKNKALKKKALKKVKSKSAKKRRIGKKILKKLKEQEKKKKKYKESDDEADKKKDKKSKKKKLMKAKKKLSKKKKKIKIKSSSSSSSDSSDTDSESDSEKDKKKKAKKKSVDLKKKKSKKRKQSTSDSTQSEELFDVNILNNIKTERLTDDDFSPRRQKPREIINVKELQNDFVGNNIQIKKEIIEQVTPEGREIDVDETSIADSVQSDTKEKACKQSIEKNPSEVEIKSIPIPDEVKLQNERTFPDVQTPEEKAPLEVKLSDKVLPEIKTDKSLPEVRTEGRTVAEVKAMPEDSNISQSSQESVYSVKEPPSYEKDDSYLRPSSQNSNYNFHDVIASHAEYKHDDVTAGRAEYKHKVTGSHEYQRDDVTASHEYKHDDVTASHEYKHNVTASHEYKHDDVTASHEYKHKVTASHEYKHDDVTAGRAEYKHNVTASHQYKHDDVTASHEYKHDDADYEAGSYEMYEQLAMAYQSDVANQLSPCGGERRIETVVHARCGEIKCDWRPGDHAPVKSPRPSRWGLKPSEVNIVLTGGGEADEADESPQRVFPIQSLANRDHNDGYDEAYLDMYGAADRLQYGDCFSEGGAPAPGGGAPAQVDGVPAPRSSLDARIDQALRSSVLGEVAKETEESQTESDKTIATNAATEASRGMKRVSFADGYKPGQDSDVEEPPVKKRKKARRVGSSWPCPATHPDHVPLWDALPPPPPPPGSPPRGLVTPRGAVVPPRPLMPTGLQPHIIPGTTNSQLLPGTQPHMMPGTTQPHMMPGTPHPHMMPGTTQPHMLPGNAQPHMLPGNVQPHMLSGASSGPHMLTRPPGMMPGPRMLPTPNQMLNMPHAIHAQFDPNTSLPGFLPPEPPPGLIALR